MKSVDFSTLGAAGCNRDNPTVTTASAATTPPIVIQRRLWRRFFKTGETGTSMVKGNEGDWWIDGLMD
jgi:hypothetical protein